MELEMSRQDLQDFDWKVVNFERLRATTWKPLFCLKAVWFVADSRRNSP